MGYFMRLLRSNAHILNYTVTAVVVVCPVVAFALYRTPPQSEIESTLAANYGDEIRSSRRKADQLHRFWAQRDSTNMDPVYSQLLRAGKASVKRHHELTGALADAEMAQNTDAARSVAPLLRAVAAQPAPPSRPPAAAASNPHPNAARSNAAAVLPSGSTAAASTPPPVAPQAPHVVETRDPSSSSNASGHLGAQPSSTPTSAVTNTLATHPSR